MARKPKLQVEICPNQHCRQFRTNFKLTEERVGKMLGGRMMMSELEELNKAGDAAKKIVIGVDGIEGIETFSLTSYELQVVKAPLFDWEEIEPQIIALVRMVGQELLNEEVEHIEKPIWEFQKWGVNADGTPRRLGMFEDVLNED